MIVDTILNYVGFAIAIFSILISYYFYRKSIIKKEPRFCFQTRRRISKLSEDSDIKILFKGKEVPSIYSTRIWIWNQGRKPITKNDIPKKTKLFIELIDEKKKLEIIGYEKIKVSREEINFKIDLVSLSKIKFDFDFLDKNDGAVLEIHHTGNKDSKILIDGTLLEAPEGFKRDGNFSDRNTLSNVMLRIARYIKLKNPSRYFKTFSIFVLIYMFGLIALNFIDLKTNPRINVSKEELQTAVAIEFPTASQENFDDIFVGLSKSQTKENSTFLIVFGIIAILMTILVVYTNWIIKEPSYPRNLKINPNSWD